MRGRIIQGWRRVPLWFWRDILLPVAATRLGLVLVALLGFHLLPLRSAFPLSWEIDRAGNRRPTELGTPGAHPLVNMWARWDAGWYLQIAKHGYEYHPGPPSSAAFFPAYPLAVYLIHGLLLFPDSDYWYLVAGLIVSNAALLLSLIFLHRLLRLEQMDTLARPALLYLCLFPTSFFLSAVYSESLFLFLAILAFYFARSGRWWMAATASAAACLSRSQGIILIVPLAAEWFMQSHEHKTRSWFKLAAVFVLPACALALFASYLRFMFGDWLVIFHAQQPWGRQLRFPWQTISWTVRHAPALSSTNHDWLDLAFWLLLLVVAAMACARLRLCYTLYLWTAVIFFASWGMLGSVPRFVLVIFPMFMVLAAAGKRSRAFDVVYLSICSMLSAIFFFMHSQWNWVA